MRTFENLLTQSIKMYLCITFKQMNAFPELGKESTSPGDLKKKKLKRTIKEIRQTIKMLNVDQKTK